MLLVFEMALFVTLIFPMPFNVKRKIFTCVITNLPFHTEHRD
jgi:hypothetical protein